jgi:hypothetical protein
LEFGADLRSADDEMMAVHIQSTKASTPFERAIREYNGYAPKRQIADDIPQVDFITEATSVVGRYRNH